MIKKILISIFLIYTISISAAVTVEYYNKDSKSYTFDAKCSGMNYKVTFESSRTAATTIQNSGPCVIETSYGKVELKGGEKIEIKDGKITIK